MAPPERQSIVQTGSGKAHRSPGQKRQGRVLLFTVVLVAAVAVAAYLLLMPSDESYLLNTYDSATVTRADMVQRTQASGTVVIPNQLTVSAPDLGGGEGYAFEVYVAVGDLVEKGEPLAQIEVPELVDDLSETQADLEDALLKQEQISQQNAFSLARAAREIDRAKSDIADAESEIARLRELVAINASRQSELDAALENLGDMQSNLTELEISREEEAVLNDLEERSQQAVIDRYQRQIGRLQADLVAATIRSPLTGEVLELEAQLGFPGSPISTGQKLLTVADRTSARVELEVQEEYASQLQVGGTVALSVSGESLSGTIETIGRVATMSSDGLGATVVVTVVPEPGADLLPGSSAVSEIVVGIDEDVLQLPRGPYLTTGSQRYLFVIDGDVARRVQVSYGRVQTDVVQIVSGVAEGDTVIVSGYQNYVQFDEVRLGGLQ